ncbi:MAG TPA: glycoside hydrolase family 172 protein [Fimbriimonadaceae bacterium]|nr:glycoside hydrolase family 172 protein [Fimbriimonadaceae bacterium]
MAFPHEPLFTIPDGVETRWATAENPAGAKGGACAGNDGRKRNAFRRGVAVGASVVLAEASGTSGTIRRIWITIDDRSPEMLRGLRIDGYWDGAATPALSAPFGDFFGHGLGEMARFENELFASPEGESFNSFLPMPFKTGMRLVVTNEAPRPVELFFYEVDFTVGDPHGPETLYLHTHWRRESPTTKLRDYEFLPLVEGRGRYVGTHVGVQANTDTYFKSWWGEGEVKIYLDGDREQPTLCGTGTEDYVGTGWGLGEYAHRFQGCPLADRDRSLYAFYRYHIPDPVYFHRDIRVTCQQMGCWDPATLPQFIGTGLQLYWGKGPVDMQSALAAKGYGMFEREDDWSSCAFFYLDRPDNELPLLAPPDERLR